jgi:hypothetical protein
VGDTMTFKILTDDSHKVVHRSVIRPAKDDRFKNKRVRFESTPTPDLKDEDETLDDTGLTFGRR